MEHLKITVIGTGYVGLVSGICYAELGHEVFCVDNNQAKIDLLRSGDIPIYEPGLQELSVRNMKADRIVYTSDLSVGVRQSDIIVIAVGTPPKESGEADLQYIEAVAAEIADAMNGYKIIAIKSTVPVGTNELVQGIIQSRTSHPFDMASMPEFLREGSALQDTMSPDRVVIGVTEERAGEVLVKLHRRLTDQIVVTDIRSAEMIKYASNAFLATKISFINEIANICEKVGADVTEVAAGMGLDKRIGASFLRAGIGYGGSCFPKDTKALIQIAGNVKYDFKLLKAVVEVNQKQRFNMIDKLRDALGNLKGRTIGVWGLAFKPNTDDVRDTPALEIIEYLTASGAIVKAYDPVAQDNFRGLYDHGNIIWCQSALEAAADTDGLCLLTEWSEFEEVDLQLLEQLMKQPIVIDGRNVYSPERLEETHIVYYPVGKQVVNRNLELEQVLD